MLQRGFQALSYDIIGLDILVIKGLLSCVRKACYWVKIVDMEFYESYVNWKSHKVNFRKVPSRVQSKGGVWYLISIIGDYSKRVWVYTLMTKDQAFDKFRE